MTRSLRILIPALLIIGVLLMVTPEPAVATPVMKPVPQIDDPPPFRLPFNTEANFSTWYVIQFYGNTQSAYRRRVEWYAGGQGVHFGVDFAAKCGTDVVAIGDGIILKVDASEHGAGPHNLVIKHDNGYASLYGHLLERPPFAPFTRVEKGQVVGKTGDPDITCTSRPHLHLEIRSDTLFEAYNPVMLIDADWDTLALFGPNSGFQTDLTDPRRWSTPYDQPDVAFGKGLINEFEDTWPPDW